MSSSEDDYMADTFVSAPASTSAHPASARPGLIHSRIVQQFLAAGARKRRHDEQQQQRSRPAMRRLEEDARTEGLQTALTADNKGFAMLARMGYKAGQSLGKPRQADDAAETARGETVGGGIVEPIGIQLKTDRGGLGRAAALQQLSERRGELRRQKLLQAAADGKDRAVSTEEFRARLTAKAQERQLDSDLGKSQRACEKLDLGESIAAPALPWFWPIRQAADAGDDDEVDDQPADTLIRGVTEDGDDVDADADAEAEEIVYNTAEKLGMLTAYLRTTYCYCHWCGVHYTDASDLQQNCPGETKDEH